MADALIILHAAPDAPENRALTALRLAGAMLAENKTVHLFLVEDGARLVDRRLSEENACRKLFIELLGAGLDAEVCGGTLKKLGWDETYLPAGVKRSSMKGLSALVSQADEVVSF